LYKNGKKVVQAESDIKFLNKCLDENTIPKCFKVKNTLPGNSKVNEVKLKKVSLECMKEELEKNANVFRAAIKEFEKNEVKVREVFDHKDADSEMKRVKEHLKRIKWKIDVKKKKKVNRDLEQPIDTVDALDQDNDIENNVEGNNSTLPERKKKRKFKRKYLQPQPKRKRRRRQNFEQTLQAEVLSGWNGIVKNISDIPVSETEEKLLSKGQKFCPVELSRTNAERIKLLLQNSEDKMDLL
jgi:hypothetical protein